MQQPSSLASAKTEGRSSPVTGGHGLYATAVIEPGEVVACFGGRVIGTDEVMAMGHDLRRLTLQIDEGLYILSECEGIADWINHSCEPSCGMRGPLVLVALRRLFPGDEITFDYAMTDGSSYDEFECQCGVATCRGRVSAEDWKQPALQERYADSFSPYLLRRMASSKTRGRRRRAPARRVHAS